MSTSAEDKPSRERPVEIGPPPYYHRSDCNICRKQDGLKTGSELLDAPRPGGYIVEGVFAAWRSVQMWFDAPRPAAQEPIFMITKSFAHSAG
jgi:hypothetical protein